MERVSTSTNDAALAAYAAGFNAPGYFTDGNPGDVDGTIPGAQWFNQVQEELINAIEDDGIASDVTADDQLATRLSPLKGIKTHATDTGAADTTHRRAVVASGGCQSSGANSVNAASDTCTATGAKSGNVASSGCDATGAGSANAASVNSDATGIASANVAAEDSLASGNHSANVGVNNCDATGAESGNLAAKNSNAGGDQSANVATIGSTNDGTDCAHVACSSGDIDAGAADCAAVACASPKITAAGYMGLLGGSSASAVTAPGPAALLASQNAELHDALTLATGYSAGAYGALGAANQNLTFKVDVTNGDGYFDGAPDVGAADYAELFELAEPGALPSGALVAGVGAKVRLARKGDRIRGVVSACPGVIGNTASLGWAGKWARDEFGGLIRETHHRVAWPAITRPSAARLAAEAAMEEAGAVLHAAVEMAQRSGLCTEDKRRHLLAPSAELTAAWRALLPWKRPRQRVPVRVPENEPHWQRYEAARETCAVADKAMRAEVDARIADAHATLKAAQEGWQAAKAAVRAVAHDVEVVRAAFDGLEADAPQPIPEDAKRYSVQARQIAEGYDPSKPYVSRRDRPDEWAIVGLTGQIRARVDATVDVGDMVEPSDVPGVGTKAKKEPRGRPVECMEIVSSFDAERGYAIALCLVG